MNSSLKARVEENLELYLLFLGWSANGFNVEAIYGFIKYLEESNLAFHSFEIYVTASINTLNLLCLLL